MNNIPKINLKYLIIVVISITALMIAASLVFNLFNKPKLSQSTPQQANSSPAPAIQAPTVSSFSAVVKEVKNGKLLIETQDSKSIEIPVDKNVTFEAWVQKDGKDKPPTRQSATSTDLKIGQKIDIFKTEVSNKPPVYEITIFNY